MASIVPKRTVDGPSLVFVAGVEGTGHHMLCAALAPRCAASRSSTTACFKVDKRLESLASALVYSSMSRWRSDRAAMVERLRGYHSHAGVFSNSSQRRMMLQCTDSLGSGLGFKMSYPDDTLSLRRDSEKEGKTTAHGDVGVLAELAEEAQIDLRIVVLTRDLARCGARSPVRTRWPNVRTRAAARHPRSITDAPSARASSPQLGSLADAAQRDGGGCGGGVGQGGTAAQLRS